MSIIEFTKNKMFLSYIYKILKPLIILLILYITFVFGLIIPTLEKNLYNEKIETTKRLTELLYSDLLSRQDEIDKGLVSEAEHKQRVIKRYDKFRFGKRNTDYFWIIDERGYVILHPYVKSIVNVDPKTVKGPDGKPMNLLIDKMKYVANTTKGGTIEYFWQLNDDASTLTKKMSYVKKFEPWNWIIGAGVYIEEIEEELSYWRNRLIFFGILLVLITVVINILISVASIKSKIDEEIAQKKFEDSREIYQTIFDISPFFIVIQKLSDSTYVMVNKAFSDFTRKRISEIIGKKPEEVGKFIDNDELVNREVLIRDGKLDNVIRISKSGSKIFYFLYSSRIINYYDEKCSLTIVNDITEVRTLQEQLNHAQKMDAIGQLAGGIAHDFNNILGGMLGIIELMTIKDYSSEDRQRNLQLLLNSGKRASDLTKKLLVFARKGKLDSSPVDVHKAIKEALALMERSVNKKVIINSDLKAPQYFVIGDSSQLMNIFLNMGINAEHAMADGGNFSIKSENITLDEAYCKNSFFKIEPGDYIKIEISDTGHGIDPELLNKIFEPFFTTKEHGKGTGLGLAAVYGTVTQHKGEIKVDSIVNKGTTFTIMLPVIENKSIDDKKNHKLFNGTGRILVVDDEYIIQVMTRSMLENLGYSVVVANNGKEAVDLYKNQQDEIDLVITDMIMPEMNGKECYYKLRQIDPNVKVILVSGFTEENDINELIKDGLKGFMKKPFHTADISAMIHKIISEDKKENT